MNNCVELDGIHNEYNDRLSNIESGGATKLSLYDVLFDIIYPKKDLDTYLKNAQDAEVGEEKRQRRNLHYLGILKSYARLYASLNESLSAEMKALERQLQLDKSYLGQNSISKSEMEQFDSKLKVYGSKIANLEKHNPWLKDPMFSLPNIQDQALRLNCLREAKSALIKQLEVYKGLKPTLEGARSCLRQAKISYEKLLSDDN